MKFGKEYAAQMVQEWQDAYMDYNSLKMELKEILNGHERRPRAASAGPLKRRISLYRAFSGLTDKYRNSPQNEDEVILTSVVAQTEGSESYRTTFLVSSDEGGEKESVFFKKLDSEFNKVLKFYKKKVEEMVVEADELSKQMNAMIALRVKVENPTVGFVGSDHGVSSSSSSGQPIYGRKPERPKMDSIQEVEMSHGGGHMREENEEEEEGEGEAKGNNGGRKIKGFKPAPLEILDHIKINVTPDTPISTLKGIAKISSDNLTYSKQELKKSEDLMSQAFMEFYRQLQLLKSYCFLNQLAFSKIMKKYDKITCRSASKAYLKMVDSSFLSSSDEVTSLMERVEATFIKHFANGNRRKGMNTLRAKVKVERQRIIFSSGFLFGCSVALIVAIIVAIQASNLRQSQAGTDYMENIFPLYSLFGYIVLHLLMYAGNIYFWRRYKVNYTFMFGFKQGTELGSWDVLFISSAIAVLTTAGVLSSLDVEMHSISKNLTPIIGFIPLIILGIVSLVMIIPFNAIFRLSRFFLIRSLFHCFLAPLYKITLVEFFLADQLTSQVQAFRCLPFYVCYYGWGYYAERKNNCAGSDVYKAFYFVVAMIPYWLRSLQCLRRVVEEKSYMQLLNGVKYFSTIVAVAMRTSFELNATVPWRILAGATSGVATILSTYWDIVIDWGLLQPHSKNAWLRDKLLIPNKSVYFIAMVLNVILRLAWMQTVLGYQIPFLHRTAVVAVVACLEIIRRGIWNFFRLENEHLNNVGKYRAFKSVPLPFDHEHEHTNIAKKH